MDENSLTSYQSQTLHGTAIYAGLHWGGLGGQCQHIWQSHQVSGNCTGSFFETITQTLRSQPLHMRAQGRVWVKPWFLDVWAGDQLNGHGFRLSWIYPTSKPAEDLHFKRLGRSPTGDDGKGLFKTGHLDRTPPFGVFGPCVSLLFGKDVPCTWMSHVLPGEGDENLGDLWICMDLYGLLQVLSWRWSTPCANLSINKKELDIKMFRSGVDEFHVRQGDDPDKMPSKSCG